MVAEAKGVTKAAGKNPNKQSQFSRQINELEAFFGLTLMQRHGRGIVLSSAGRRLLQISREIFTTLEDFHSECKSDPKRFSIGAGDSLLQWILLPQLDSIKKALPSFGIDLYGLRTLEIIDRVSELGLDFGLVRRDAVTSTLEFRSLGSETYALFVSRDAIDGGKNVKASDVIGKMPLATIIGPGRFRSNLMRKARKHDPPLTFALCCSTFPQAARALRSGRFAAVLPTIARQELTSEQFLSIPIPFFETESREICLIWNPRAAELRPKLTSLAEGLAKFLILPSEDYDSKVMGHGFPTFDAKAGSGK